MFRRVIFGAVAATLVSVPALASPEADPTGSPTDEMTLSETQAAEPTDAPVGDQTVLPTDEPAVTPRATLEPTDTPTEESTVTPTDPITEITPENQAPAIHGLTPITAISRDYVTQADLFAGVSVTDDQDAGLIPTLIMDPAWTGATECPNGYPCTYRMVFEVRDSQGAYANGVRVVTITGVPSTEPTDPAPEPTDPVTPTDPVSPIDPVEPTDPVSPTDPVAPTDPVSPMDPVNPTEPTQPAPTSIAGSPTDQQATDGTQGGQDSSDVASSDPTIETSDASQPTGELSDTGGAYTGAAFVAVAMLLVGSVLAGRARRDASR